MVFIEVVVNKLILTPNMWMNMSHDGMSKGYRTNIDFIKSEGIGMFHLPDNCGYGYGYVEFNTPELMTFYLLRWS